jgi:hypothetical protein
VSQLSIASDEDSVKGFSKSDVCRVIRRNIITKLPNAIEQRFVGMPLNIERPEIVESGFCCSSVNLAFTHISSEGMNYFNIDKVRRMEACFRVVNSLCDEPTRSRSKDQF